MSEFKNMDERHIKGEVFGDVKFFDSEKGGITSFTIKVGYKIQKCTNPEKLYHNKFFNCTYYGKTNLNTRDIAEVKGYMSVTEYNGKEYDKFMVKEIVGQSANNAQSKNERQIAEAPDFDDDIPF